MGKILGMVIQNYGSLKDVKMGDIVNESSGDSLGNMVALIGPSGSGKSSFADAFGFLSDCISSDVETACDANHRGGFDQLVAKNSDNSIYIAVTYQEKKDQPPLTYGLIIKKDFNNRPYVDAELLSYFSRDQEKVNLMTFHNGRGYVIDGKRKNSGAYNLKDVAIMELSDTRKLGIATLGAMKQYPLIGKFLDFLKSWYLCYFSPNAARGIQTAAPSPYLNRTGDNLNNVAQYMYRENPAEFQKILADIQTKIPDITKIEPMKMINGQMELAFYQKGFEEPFFSQRMSDGTLKLFAYYLMLHEKNPRQLVFIEEPENGLYHHYLTDLALEMKRSAGNGYNKQIFVTTHSPFFVNALSPDQVWVLDKDKDGFTTAKRASEYPFVKELSEEGVSMGDLWYSKYFG